MKTFEGIWSKLMEHETTIELNELPDGSFGVPTVDGKAFEDEMKKAFSGADRAGQVVFPPAGYYDTH